MKHLYKKISLFLVVSMLFSTFAFAVNEEPSNSSVDNQQYKQAINLNEYVDQLNIDTTDAISVQWETAELCSESTNSIAAKSITNSEANIPSVAVVTQNEDGSYTKSFYVELATQDDGKLVPAISRSSSGTYYNAFANSGFVIRFDATYDEVNMGTYGYSGYAFAPRYSKYKVSSSGAYGYPTDLYFHVLLHGQFSASSSNPASRDDDWPYFSRTTNIGTPTLGYQYSYYDYTAYSNDYSGRLVHITNGGQGCHMLKCEFTYKGYDHQVKAFIYNGSDENY